MDEYQAIMTRKLGLPKYNKQLISKLLNNMAVDKVDYTNFFRTLSNVKANPDISEDELLVPLKAVLLDIGKERKEAWASWVQSYIKEVLLSFLVNLFQNSYFVRDFQFFNALLSKQTRRWRKINENVKSAFICFSYLAIKWTNIW